MMSTLKKILNVSLILLAMVAVFSSCEKDNLTEPATSQVNNQTGDNTVNATGNFLQLRTEEGEESEVDSLSECFEINYPITVNIPGAGSEEVNSEEELWILIEEWLEQAGDDLDEFPTIEFPIEVTLEDGTTQTVNDDEELCDLYHECYGDDDWEPGDDDDDFIECFEFLYPITIELEDGTIQTINSEDEWETLFDSTGVYEYFTIVYPLDVELEDGTTQTINSEEEMEELFEDCYGDWGDPGDCDSTDIYELCFEFVYPLSLTLPDGSTVTADDEEELFIAIEDYYEANPDSDEDPEFVYPVNVVLDDGTPQTVNNEDELEELFEECFGDGFGLKNPKVTQGMSRINRAVQ